VYEKAVTAITATCGVFVTSTSDRDHSITKVRAVKGKQL
jgi:hypothetical protein